MSWTWSILSQDTARVLPWSERLRLIVFTPFYVALGVSVLVGSPVLALLSRTSKTAKRFIFWLSLRTVIPTLRYFLDTVPTWLVLTWWLRSKNIAQDGLRVTKDVAIGSPSHYGAHSREWAQCLHPIGSAQRRDGDRVILYCHGGGHLAANCVLLMPSVTPLVRAGYTIWCMNYPLSPESIFPGAVESVLRCLQWLKREHNVNTVALCGDSAGGNLVTMAAAFACNSNLCQRLKNASEFKDGFPELNGVVSMYGLLDRTSPFENETGGISRLEQGLSRFALRFIFQAYTGDEDFDGVIPNDRKGALGGRCTISDVMDLIDNYPKTFLVVGKCDVLVHSSRKCHRLLCDRGFQSELHEYDARHAFIGLPPALNIGGTWPYHSKPATEQIIKFLEDLPWST